MFANFKAKLLRVDLRKAGKKVFVFETSARLSAGELEALNEMIDQEVAIGLDSQIISYRIQKNARTDEPLINYKVREGGLVEQVKKEGEQAELDLGLPKEKQKIKEEAAEIKREIVEEFILDGLAPRYEDLEYDFAKIIQRHADGESYLRLASELEMSSGKLAELLDEYCKRVAPLAAKWDEWRESQVQEVDKIIAQATAESDPKPEEPGQKPSEIVQSEGDDQGPEQPAQQPDGSDDAELIKAIENGEPKSEPAPVASQPKLEDIESYIISNSPKFEDIEYDFAAILSRKKETNETWREIANSMGIGSGVIQAAYSEVKKRVKKILEDRTGAA